MMMNPINSKMKGNFSNGVNGGGGGFVIDVII